VRTGIRLGDEPDLTIRRKLLDLNWLLILLVMLVACAGFLMLYSAAGGDMEPWASRQMVRFAVGLVLMVMLALVDIRTYLRYAYVIYALVLLLLVGVELTGFVGMGARRWIDLGFFQLQPSELMKIALVLALARYFHRLSQDEARRIRHLVVPLALVLAPVLLVLRQPDLGTALLLLASAAMLFWLAGVSVKVFVAAILAVLAAVPLAWQFVLHEYQRNRVLTFLDPERDPLGAGYHITQSKIALGSGGLFGKGFLAGSQSHLHFLPEKQTDFVFTMLAEEFGLVGGLALLGLYGLLIGYGAAVALRARNQFGRLVAYGIANTLFLYVFINMAMVMGLIPVVGVPLPLMSYGGTAMMTLLIGLGLLMNVYVHRDMQVPRRFELGGM
jgi:rod shape determining protein RodA